VKHGSIPTTLALTLLIVPCALAFAEETPKDPGCTTCHGDVGAARTAGEDVHAKLSCVDCHGDKHGNPHQPSSLPAKGDVIAALFKPFTSHATAWAGCAKCHANEVDAWSKSAHAKGVQEGVDRPHCAGCHGEPHAVVKQTKDKLKMSEQCVACHAFAEGRKAPQSMAVVDTYRETIHGRMLHLGNTRAPSCADCHGGGHAVLGASEPASTVHMGNRAKTCGKCHEQSTAEFANVISHAKPVIDEDYWSWLTAEMFAILTVSTIFLLFLHVLLDFLRAAQQAMTRRREKGTHAATHDTLTEDTPVDRFDIHARIQHWGMMSSFTTLVLTGWPLKAAAVGQSSELVAAIGGHPTLALIHRIAGAMLLAVSVYHLAYLAWMFKHKKLNFSMVPLLKDITDAVGNVLFFLGLQRERPRFGKWTYYEKFDYWAVFWGMFIMGGSGLVLWFPVQSTALLPAQLVRIAQIAHSDEALLAALAIFLWHFYNVHLRPTIFPMSPVWLTGKLSAHALWEEHREEYERLYGKLPPAHTGSDALWHRRPIWSYIALFLVVAAAAAVLVLDTSVLDRINPEGAEHAHSSRKTDTKRDEAPLAAGIVNARAPGFDAFARCPDCHAKGQIDDQVPFPHARLSDHKELVDKGCPTCHQPVWHASITASRAACADCHDTAWHKDKVKDHRSCVACHKVKPSTPAAAPADAFARCTGCHDKAKVDAKRPFPHAKADHADITAGGCTGCHTSAGMAVTTSRATCAECHDTGWHKGKVKDHGECAACHGLPLTPPASDPFARCTGCHDQAKMDGQKPFPHAKDDHKELVSAGCAACHMVVGQTVKTGRAKCTECHEASELPAQKAWETALDKPASGAK